MQRILDFSTRVDLSTLARALGISTTLDPNLQNSIRTVLKSGDFDDEVLALPEDTVRDLTDFKFGSTLPPGLLEMRLLQMLEKGGVPMRGGNFSQNPFYRPPPQKNKESPWQGRVDATDDFHAFRLHQVVRPYDLQTTLYPCDPDRAREVGLLGYAVDEGVKRNTGRPGAAEGPNAIRRVLAPLPNILGCEIMDVGDVVTNTEFAFQGDPLFSYQMAVAAAVFHLKTAHVLPIVLGGGNDVSFGHWLGLIHALREQHPDTLPTLGVINFDAHLDFRSPNEMGRGINSGTPFRQIQMICEAMMGIPFHYLCIGAQRSANTPRLIQDTTAAGAQIIYANEFFNIQHVIEKVARFLDPLGALFLTVDLDVFNGAQAPGVSAVNPQGLSATDDSPFARLFASILKTRKPIGFEVAEMSPPHDHQQLTAKLAARLVHQVASST